MLLSIPITSLLYWGSSNGFFSFSAIGSQIEQTYSSKRSQRFPELSRLATACVCVPVLLHHSDVMEKAGIPHSFKSNLLSLLPSFFTFQRVLLQAMSQSTDAIQQLGLMRILLLSAYLLHRVGLSSSVSLTDTIDLSFA